MKLECELLASAALVTVAQSVARKPLGASRKMYSAKGAGGKALGPRGDVRRLSSIVF